MTAKRKRKPKMVPSSWLADLLGVSVQTVARWIDRSLVPGRRTPSGQRVVLRSFYEQARDEIALLEASAASARAKRKSAA